MRLPARVLAKRVASCTVEMQDPTVTLKVEPRKVSVGEKSILSWTVTNCTSCEASGAWDGTWDCVEGHCSGAKEVWFDRPGDYEFSLTCNGPGGSASSSVKLTVKRPPVADANGPYSGTVGKPIQFNGSGFFDPDGDLLIDYMWHFDGDAERDLPPACIPVRRSLPGDPRGDECWFYSVEPVSAEANVAGPVVPTSRSRRVSSEPDIVGVRNAVFGP